MGKNSTKVLLAGLVVAIVFFIISVVVAFKILPDVLSDQIDEAVGLRKDTDQYDKFMELPFSVELKVYFFHIVNKESILASEMPIVKEVGPYVYRQYHHKTKLHADCDDDTITYTQHRVLQFDAAASEPLKEKDLVTVFNLPLMNLMMLAESEGRASFLSGCLSELFSAKFAELFMEVSVEDLMLKGFNFCPYTDSITCSTIWNGYCPRSGAYRYAAVEEDRSIHFSYINYRTAADDGVYTIKRGVDDVTTLGRIVSWNGLAFTDYWGKDTTCSQINGTDSVLFPPRLEKDSSLFVFSTDICRSVELDFLQEAAYSGIDGYDFGISPLTFWSGAEAAEDCFCTKLTHGSDNEENCFLDGVLDLQSCTGAPVLLSFPHFLWADKKYVTIEGIEPDDTLHRTHFVIEPNTGTLLEGTQRTQLNAVLRPIEGVALFEHLPRVVMPLLWIEEKYALSSESIDDLKSKYFNKVELFDGIRWGLLALTTLLMVVLAAILIHRKIFRK